MGRRPARKRRGGRPCWGRAGWGRVGHRPLDENRFSAVKRAFASAPPARPFGGTDLQAYRRGNLAKEQARGSRKGGGFPHTHSCVCPTLLLLTRSRLRSLPPTPLPSPLCSPLRNVLSTSTICGLERERCPRQALAQEGQGRGRNRQRGRRFSPSRSLRKPSTSCKSSYLR